MTLLSWTDSVTVNFTFLSSCMECPSDLVIISGENKFECERYRPLFIDIKKKNYEIRITSSFIADAIKNIIQSETPPIFSFRQNGVSESATYKNGAWKKDRNKLQQIYKLYEYSKR